MDNELNSNFEESIDRHEAASSEIDPMDVEDGDFSSELRRIEKEINRCKLTLQSCVDKRENIEMKICDVKQLQGKAQFVLDNVRSEEENLHERFKNIHLNYEACVKKSDSREDPSDTIQGRIKELTLERKKLWKNMMRLRIKANDNRRKLDRVKAMIAEQEEKNAMQIRELKEISESGIFISPDIRKQIDAILKHQEEVDRVINDTM